jgi:hypothetical protein
VTPEEEWHARVVATALELTIALRRYTQTRHIYGSVPDESRALEMHRQLVQFLDLYLKEAGAEYLKEPTRGGLPLWKRPHFENTADVSDLDIISAVLRTRLARVLGRDPLDDQDRTLKWAEENAVEPTLPLMDRIEETLVFDCREPLERAGAVYVSAERALFVLGMYWEFYRAVLLRQGNRGRISSTRMLRYIVNVKSRIESCLDRIAQPTLTAPFRAVLEVQFEKVAAHTWAKRVAPLVEQASEAYEAARLGIRAASFDLTDAETLFLSSGRFVLRSLDEINAAKDKKRKPRTTPRVLVEIKSKTCHEMIREVEQTLRTIIVDEARERCGDRWLAVVERLLGDALARARETMAQRRVEDLSQVIHFTQLADICDLISTNFSLYESRLGIRRKEFNKRIAGIIKGRTEEAHNRPEHLWPEIEQQRVRVACHDLLESIKHAQPPNAPSTKRTTAATVGDHEVRATPLVEFEIGNMLQVLGWDHATVPLVVHNISTHAVTIVSATLEFWAIPGGTPQSEKRPDLGGVVEVGHPKIRDLVIPLQRIPESERPAPHTGTKRIAFLVRYTVQGVTGEEVPGCSREFNL